MLFRLNTTCRQVILYIEAKKKTAEQQPQELAFAFVRNTKNTQDISAIDRGNTVQIAVSPL